MPGTRRRAALKARSTTWRAATVGVGSPRGRRVGYQLGERDERLRLRASKEKGGGVERRRFEAAGTLEVRPGPCWHR